MEQKQWSSIMLLVLYIILIAALLVLVVSGARLYGQTMGVNTEHMDERSALAFIQNQAAAGVGSPEIKQWEQGDMLCLPEEGGRYETRIYFYDGALCTQLCAADRELNPSLGQSICKMDAFTLSRESDTLLRIDANGVCAYVCCAGGGVYE